MNEVSEKACGVVTICENGGEKRILLVQHVEEHWAFPKGRVEDGETEIETARRELEEETGITEVEILPESVFVDTYKCEKNGVSVNKSVNYYIGRVVSDNVNIQKEEVRDFAWLSFHEARERITFESTKEVFDRAVRFLRDI
jgi:bis(5'-nucleosidyl)-tetraphosphatase